MINAAIPKLPMRDLNETISYYQEKLGFQVKGKYSDYLILAIDSIEMHFYLNEELEPHSNNSMVYLRVSDDIQHLYEILLQKKAASAHMGKLEKKLWGQIEFSIIDVNGNLLTFGQAYNNQ